MAVRGEQLEVGELIHEGEWNTVHRARRVSDDHPVILKLLKAEVDDLTHRARLDRELSIANLVDSPLVIKAYGLTEHQGRLGLVMEDFGGESLRARPSGGFPTRAGLGLALGIARSLAVVHRAGIVHRDIKPSNVIHRPGTDEIKISDFGSSLTREDMHTQAASVLEGTLAYMAPEQTGRMRRPLDRRSDLYSFGVLLYELLTGELPFRATGALEWMHFHAAQIPRPLTEVDKAVPEILSRLVLKLLAKDPEERYQSADAIVRDLSRCRELLTPAGTIASFPLAARDVSDEFRLPERVYGRDREIADMRATFDRVAQSSHGEVLLLAGYSGIGKTSLVRELQMSIAQRSGFFAAGKFDQYRRHVPYSAIALAGNALVHQLLTTSNNRLATWRDTLITAVDGNGRVLVDLIPELDRLLPNQPPVADLSPTGMQNRLHHSMRAFLRAFDVPLVLFLDDLQWADAASLDLLEALLAQESQLPLLVILSYRDHEVGPSHPLAATIDRLRTSHAQVHTLTLGSLDLAAVKCMVGDTLQTRDASRDELAAFAMTKTAGNPFFVREFLRTLYLDGLLRFDSASAAWRFEPAAVQASRMTDNVVRLMIERLQKLPPATQEALRIGAFLGSEAALDDLAAVIEKPVNQVADDLRSAAEKGLVVFQSDQTQKRPTTVRFAHDRIQQAANELTPDAERASTHLRVGRLLWHRLDKDPLASRLFEVANHIDAAFDLIVDEGERERMLTLFRQAARKAKGALAYQQLCLYLRRGQQILAREDGWNTRFELTFNLHVSLAEHNYLAGNLAEARALFADLLTRAQDDLQRGRIYYLQIRLFQVSGLLADAADLCLRSFALFGLSPPVTDADATVAVGEGIARVGALIAGRPIADRIDDPVMTDPRVRMLVNLLEVSGPPIYMVRPALFSWVALQMVELSLHHGNTETSCYGYGIYALLRAAALGDVEGGYELSQLAIQLNAKFADPKLEGCMLHLLGDHVNFWKNKVASDLPILEKGFAACVRAGDHIYSNYIGFQAPWHLYESGASIADVMALTEKGKSFATETKYDAVLWTIRAEQQFLRALKGETQGKGQLGGEDFDETEALAVIAKASFGCGVVYLHILKMIARYTFGDYQGALEAADLARPELGAAFSMPIYVSYTFYYPMILAALHSAVNDDETARAARLAAMNTHHGELTTWAKACPANFADKAALLGAEIARVTGDATGALKLYEDARFAARAEGFVQYEALACERAASFYQTLGVPSVRHSLLRDAHALYARWGASGKVADMLERDRDLPEANTLQMDSSEDLAPGSARVSEAASRKPAHKTTSSSTTTNELDLTSVLKAAQSLSAEIVLPRLLPRLMSIVVEYAGAERGSLLFVEGDSLVFAAESAIASKTDAISIPVPREPSALPSTVLRYAMRTAEQVVIDDATANNPYASDPYFQRAPHRSVLCKPIKHHGRVIAMLYLENNLVAGAFTPSRLVSLEVLAAQTAISIENSRLYEASRAAVVARDEFLSIASHELRTPLTPLAIHIHRLTSAIHKGTLRAMSDHALQKIAASCDEQIVRLSRLVETLLDVSRIGSGTLYLQKERIDLGGLVTAIVEAHAPDALSAGCTVSLHLEAALAGQWDKVRLQQVVTNLLINAFKFGREHPVVLTVRRVRDTAELMVSDHGPGIKKEDRNRIFERFERVASATNVDGIGLGLFIVRAIVEAHEGQVRVEDTIGGGSTFRVTLPID